MFIVTQVKPEMLNEWLDIQKNEVNPALKKAGVARRAVYRTRFGNTYEFVGITPLDKYAQLDQPNVIVRALGPEAAARLSEKSRKCVNGSRIFVSTQIANLRDAPDSPAPVIVTTRRRVAPGKRQEYLAFLRNEILPLLKKAKADGKIAGSSVSGRGFGSFGGEITSTTYYPNFAGLDGPGLFGSQAEATKVLAKGQGLSTLLETVVRERIADLSY